MAKLQMKQKTAADYFDDFIRVKKALGAAKDTIDIYNDCWKRFDGFLQDDCFPIEEINSNLIIQYIEYLSEANIKPASINHNLRHIKAYCLWLMSNGYIANFKIRLVKEEEVIKETYTNEELKKLLANPTKNDSFITWRTWAIINFIIGTGCRIGTVAEIKMEDLDFNRKSIKLTHTKNKKQQIIPMSDNLASVLKKYIRCWRYAAEDADFLFCNDEGGAVTTNSLKLATAKYNHHRGVAKTSNHLFRHTFAKLWILNGGDAFRLQKMLGHSTMEMTKRYVQMFSEDLQRDFSKFNPLDNLQYKKQLKPQEKYDIV